MGQKDVPFNFTGGTAGWKGDVPRYQYDLTRIKSLGWPPATPPTKPSALPSANPST